MITRLVQYDLLKGIGILLVLLGHAEQLPLHAKLYIYAFHMPLFFFLSGVFFKPGSIKNVVVKGLKQLIVPWAFFLGVLYLSYLLVSLKAGGLGAFLDVISKHSNPLDEDAKLWLSIWFLPCLFLVRVLYSLLVSIICRIGGGKNIVSGICLMLYLLSGRYFELPFFIDTALGVLIYYDMGHRFHYSQFDANPVKMPIILTMIALLVVMVEALQPSIDLKSNQYPVYQIVLFVLATLPLYHLCQWLKIYDDFSVVKFFVRCGEASITLFGLHRPLWLFVVPVCYMLHLDGWLSVGLQVLVAVPLSLLAHKIISKSAPFLIGRK